MSEHLAYRAGRAAGRAWHAARRRPRASAALAVPAALLLTLAPDLFLTIPWPARKAMGWAAFLALAAAGIARLLAVRPGDRWPAAEPGIPGRRSRWEAVLPWALAAAASSLAWPLMRDPGGLGFGDWDHHLQKFEVIRRTVLDHGQFPWWTPWTRGGFPLASEPECGVVSVATPMVLALGARAGLRLATIACLLIAVEGARRLARLWIGDPWAAVAAGLVYGMHGGILVYVVAGHYIPMSYCATPWLICATCRLADGPARGLMLGAWAAFNVLNGVTYPSVYGMILAGLFWLRGLRVERGDRRRRFVVQTALALGTFLAASGWRLATMLAVLRDYPRAMGSFVDLSPLFPIVHMIRRPSPGVMSEMAAPILWESNCYLGVLGLALFLLGFRGGWRWWHALAIGGFALATGAGRWWHPSYWLAHVPVFSTMHMVVRWLIPAMLGVGLTIAEAVARWRGSGARGASLLAPAAVVLLGADLLVVGHRILPLAAGAPPTPAAFPGPPTTRLVNVERWASFPAALHNYGVVRAHEPLLGYDRGAPTARLWVGHPDYVAEAWSGGLPVEPESWSPNRLVFRVDPFQEVELNLNPGSWWLVNGERTFAGLRCAEWRLPFAARADADGRLELRISPVGLGAGLALHAAGAGLLLVIAAGSSLRARRPDDASLDRS